MLQIEKQREEYYKSLGTPPGVPTMKGATADPDNTGYGYNTIIGELGDHSVPEGWVQRPKRNTTPGTPPGPPIQWNKPEDPDNAQPGYGYVPTDTTNTEEIFFYHSDHLGSTSYITDAKANITQFDAYLPYGELLVDEHSSSEEMPYKFNGKELDQETGLYYYGARYMNPVTSLWYGVDPQWYKLPYSSPYSYCIGNPILLHDPNGAYPVITITKEKTGQQATQRVIGYTGFHNKALLTTVDLYKATVTDTEDVDFHMEFTVTRDAFIVRQGGNKQNGTIVLTNVAFEPKDEQNNEYVGVVKPEHPRGNATVALVLTQDGNHFVPADPSDASVELGYRNKADIASGVMLHVGGRFLHKGRNAIAASEGCFGVTDGSDNPSNDYSNDVLNSIINQANKSETDKGKIGIVIMKRNETERTRTKNVKISSE